MRLVQNCILLCKANKRFIYLYFMSAEKTTVLPIQNLDVVI